MENPKKTRGDGIFGWPISAFTFVSTIAFMFIGTVFELTGAMGPMARAEGDDSGPAYVGFVFGVIVEVIHYKWKQKKMREEG